MNRTQVVAGLALFAAAAPAWAAETQADWLKKPTPEQLFAVWPTEAMKKGIGGRAVIYCTISAQGALYGCKVESETPAGMGFGTAAIALTPQFLMKPATRDGKPVESGVSMPINFVAPGGGTGSHIPGGRDPSLTPFTRTVASNLPWTAAPAYADVAAAYPEKARAAAVGGRATLKCTLKADGRLSACSTVTEEPKGYGFAQAARALTAMFIAPTQFSDGRPIAGALTQVPFVFAPEMLDPARRVVGRPQWAALPSGSAMTAGYPREALAAGVKDGRVVMACATGDGGQLQNCAVEREEPAGLGFAASGLALSQSFRIRPWTDEGLPTIGGLVRVPIRYVLPEEPAPAAPPRP